MTMIVVTHEMGFARKVAHRVIFMDRGRILEDAPTEVFFASPRTERAQLSCRRCCGIRAGSEVNVFASLHTVTARKFTVMARAGGPSTPFFHAAGRRRGWSAFADHDGSGMGAVTLGLKPLPGRHAWGWHAWGVWLGRARVV